MSYYNIWGLEKEPFSTSPDPDFFYRSDSHNAALKRLEIALRLRRGLCLILGDIGTGKTTLLRALLQLFKEEEDFEFHIILSPNFKSEYQFLLNLVKIFNIAPAYRSTLDLKEALERYLFQKGVEENKTIVLLIDEGQKMTLENLEILRTLLNYETNEYKLLQLVIMSQLELLPRLKKMRNFIDRLALRYTINPLDESQTKEMIQFRLEQAGYHKQNGIFSDETIGLIYQYTQGYPRKISMLCHSALEAAVMQEASSVDVEIIKSLIANENAYE